MNSGLPYAPLDESNVQAIVMSETKSPSILPANVIVVPPAPTTGLQYPSGPYATSTTTVVTQQPTPSRPWSSNICDCCNDMHSCCCMLFCGNFYLGCLASRMGEHCCVGCAMPGLWPMRAAIRERHHIQGDLCSDAAMVSWCAPCVACQIARELDYLQYPKSTVC